MFEYLCETLCEALGHSCERWGMVCVLMGLQTLNMILLLELYNIIVHVH